MLEKHYTESMRAHVDEGGQLSHRNGCDLLAEVERLQQEIVDLRIGIADRNGFIHRLRVAGCALMVDLREAYCEMDDDPKAWPGQPSIAAMKALCALKDDAIEGYAKALDTYFHENALKPNFDPSDVQLDLPPTVAAAE